ncbi:MAG: hypothetical protein ACK559_22275 [bacterium]
MTTTRPPLSSRSAGTCSAGGAGAREPSGTTGGELQRAAGLDMRPPERMHHHTPSPEKGKDTNCPHLTSPSTRTPEGRREPASSAPPGRP